MNSEAASRALLLSALGSSSSPELSPLRYEAHLNIYSAAQYPPTSSPLSLLNIGLGESSNEVEEEHNNGVPPYHCSKCDHVEISSLEAFRTHLRNSHWNNTSLEDDLEDEDFEEGTPKSTSSHRGPPKSKSLKCKQCNYVGISKEDFWRHTKDHIKPEKCLSCPQCPFVTEYKHHLEYHLRNHFGSKPFKCRACNYSCVNKSMLNSHMKSHNNIFQYRCRDCSYATKYCHSLKLHLRKYKHKPDVVLNSDGSVNPLPVIDIYGTRRGPKTKKDDSGNPVIPPFVLAQVQKNNAAVNNQLNTQASPVAAIPPYNASKDEVIREEEGEETIDEEEEPSECETSQESLNYEASPKGPPLAYLEYLRTLLLGGGLTPTTDPIQAMIRKKNSESWDKCHVCSFCEVAFRDPIMHTIHMGYHGFSNPFKCNMCGEEAGDKLAFFLHVARKSHA